MTKLIPPPILSEVNTTEALQGGLAARQTQALSAKQKSRVNEFIKAHAKANEATAATVDQSNLKAAQAQPQVSATEQASAVAARGHGDIQAKKSQASRFRTTYKLLYTSDKHFLEKDLQSLIDSLKDGVKSLVDHAQHLNPQEKALRKWILAQIALENQALPESTKTLLHVESKKLLAQHGDYIESAIAFAEAGETLKLSKPKLKEFIKAYQLMEFEGGSAGQEVNSSELMNIFKSVKPVLERPNYTQELVNMHNGFINVLQREQTQNPAKVTSTRQHMVLSRIKQFGWLIRTMDLHQKFLTACSKAQVHALPKLGDLVEACLQTIIASDMYSGINSIVRMAGAVDAASPSPQNMFITNYNRLVLQSDLLKTMYRGNFHRKQVVDHMEKTVKSAGILANTSQHSVLTA